MLRICLLNSCMRYKYLPSPLTTMWSDIYLGDSFQKDLAILFFPRMLFCGWCIFTANFWPFAGYTFKQGGCPDIVYDTSNKKVNVTRVRDTRSERNDVTYGDIIFSNVRSLPSVFWGKEGGGKGVSLFEYYLPICSQAVYSLIFFSSLVTKTVWPIKFDRKCIIWKSMFYLSEKCFSLESTSVFRNYPFFILLLWNAWVKSLFLLQALSFSIFIGRLNKH